MRFDTKKGSFHLIHLRIVNLAVEVSLLSVVDLTDFVWIRIRLFRASRIQIQVTVEHKHKIQLKYFYIF